MLGLFDGTDAGLRFGQGGVVPGYAGFARERFVEQVRMRVPRRTTDRTRRPNHRALWQS